MKTKMKSAQLQNKETENETLSMINDECKMTINALSIKMQSGTWNIKQFTRNMNNKWRTWKRQHEQCNTNMKKEKGKIMKQKNETLEMINETWKITFKNTKWNMKHESEFQQHGENE